MKRNADKGSILYCKCRKPYDPTKLYIFCDNCKEWFHGSCVNQTESSAIEKIDKFVCPDCEIVTGKKRYLSCY